LLVANVLLTFPTQTIVTWPRSALHGSKTGRKLDLSVISAVFLLYEKTLILQKMSVFESGLEAVKAILFLIQPD